MLQSDVDLLAGVVGGQVANAIGLLPAGMTALAADGAVPITQDGAFLITKAGACLLSIAAPGAGNIGRVLDLISGTANAHVLTFTGGTVRGGVAGVTTGTMAAQIGARLKVRAISATVWQVETQITCPLT
jgi:hypothetical protein